MQEIVKNELYQIYFLKNGKKKRQNGIVWILYVYQTCMWNMSICYFKKMLGEGPARLMPIFSDPPELPKIGIGKNRKKLKFAEKLKLLKKKHK